MILSPALALFLFVSITPVQADDRQLEQCQYLVNQLTQIKKAKRKGGSSKYLNSLRKERHRLDKLYFQLRCSMTKELLTR